MDKTLDQMKLTHAICINEIYALFGNLNKFLADSAETFSLIQTEIEEAAKNTEKNDGCVGKNFLNLLKYDSYMTNLVSVTSSARNLNVFLQVQKFSNFPTPDQVSLMGTQIALQLQNLNLNNMPIENSKCNLLEHKQGNEKELKWLVNNNLSIPLLDLEKYQEGYEFKGLISNFPYKNNLVFYASLVTKSDLMKFRFIKRIRSLKPPLPRDRIFGVIVGTKEIMLRARLVDGEHLMLIDFGDIINAEDDNEFFELPEELTTFPGLALPCMLEGINDPDELQDHDIIHMINVLNDSFMEERNFKVVRQENGVLHVRLYEAKFLEEKQLETSNAIADADCNTCDESFADEVDAYSLNNIRPNHEYRVIVTHIQGLSFYGQLLDNNCGIKSLCAWTNEEVPLDCRLQQIPKKDELVLARYEKDKLWYRATVEDYNPKTKLFKVYYVDFGNREFVPLSSLAKCGLCNVLEPYRAILFVIDGLLDITVGDVVYEQKAAETLQCLLEQEVKVFVLQHTEKFCSIRIIDERFEKLPEILINEGYAVPNVFS